MMNKKIIVDTSIWIEYFKNNEKITKIIDSRLENGTIVITGPIFTELIQGIKNENEKNLIINYIDGVDYLKINKQSWIQAGRISNSLRKQGITIPFVDILITTVAIENDLIIMTLDKHFRQIPNITLFPL